MIEVDRAMVEDFGIDLTQMMENAGRALAELARARFLDGDPTGHTVHVLAGSGGNGGGAMVAARRLDGYGARVKVSTTKALEDMAGVPARQREILDRIGVPVHGADRVHEADPPDLVIDGIVGYSLKGAPRGAAATLIEWANDQPAPVLALDTPSGVSPGSGVVFSPAIRADATLTLALPKSGLREPTTRDLVGELYLADIGVPPSLYASPALRLEVGPIFANSDIVRLA
jgi:NAD(P)H-hydrate epimerase